MAVREINLPEVGMVSLSKRRGMKNIRISVRADGRVLINMPRWTPFSVGESFAKKHRIWILEQQRARAVSQIQQGDIIGRGAVVAINLTQTKRTITKVTTNSIKINSPFNPESAVFQKSAKTAAEKALKLQAESYLPKRINELSHTYKLSYKSLRVRRLSSRWGSCSSKNNISLSTYLMQLPDELIDYVITHELVHTKHMNHGKGFWKLFEELMPEVKQLRKKLRLYPTALTPTRQ